ncbi:Hypothetical protein, putative [Bodo saltans]|uniref:Uncharacterized protein n=1 Tax=Bodo saltans TaxID=75058 RepID=A0A0S4J0R4_BODSA|nr:Hypothetical protein, putative [Bodo saltans]|eukprot:CUG44451.1 Hypothetical protein, putative [Bodo saltans]
MLQTAPKTTRSCTLMRDPIYFTNEEGKTLFVDDDGGISELHTNHVVAKNTQTIFTWVLQRGLYATENAVYQEIDDADDDAVDDDAQGSEGGARGWSSYGMFVRAVGLVCRDIKEMLHAMLIHGAERMLHIMVHSDGLSIAIKKKVEHFDVAGNVRTPETSMDAANEAMEVLTHSHGLRFGAVIALIIDTRSCELWYIEFFERYFSQFYAVVKVFFSDVSRKSMCDPEDVEAINPLYTKFLASMPPMESLSDARLKTDTAQYLG